jgi:glycosyltransferase involved in cell wall biosynthesis
MSVCSGGSESRVAIVMGLHDAGPSLSAQLESFLDQNWRRWDLYVGDDGGTARDLAELEAFRERAGQLGHEVCVSPGPRQGFACNYMTMLRQLSPETSFAALSDQDDIWLPSKLERAVRALEGFTGPGLYCGARVIWSPDSDLRPTSRPLGRAPSFRNALVENIACGNTIVLNAAALDLIRRSPPEADAVPFHDWWIYLLISGAGGQVIHDPAPQILYRQHSGNALGAGEAAHNWMRARTEMIAGVYRARIECNLAALVAARGLLSPDHQRLLDCFIAARIAPWPLRLRQLAKLGLYRQDPLSQLGLWGAFALARF